MDSNLQVKKELRNVEVLVRFIKKGVLKYKDFNGNKIKYKVSKKIINTEEIVKIELAMNLVKNLQADYIKVITDD